jgi:hypothetical protein
MASRAEKTTTMPGAYRAKDSWVKLRSVMGVVRRKPENQMQAG